MVRFLVLLLTLSLAGSLSAQPGELRGLWVDAFHPGFKSATEISQLVHDARVGRFNALFVQVRKRGDAYYQSTLEPKAADIARNFDPLEEMLRQAHDTSGGGQRLEVHAWIVAFNIWNRESTPPSQPDHPFVRHPEWLTEDNTGRKWDGANHAFDPGHPEVQEHTVAVAADLLTRYDLDGLHLDYIRYGGLIWGYNPVSVGRFQRLFQRTHRPAPGDLAWMQFRRDQVTAVVRRIYLLAAAQRPRLKVSAATITFAPGVGETSGWPSSAAYSSVLQDWRAWMEEGILDLNVPMAYFQQTQWETAWSRWSQFAKDHRYRRQVALGVGTFLNPPADSVDQLRSTRLPTARSSGADGMVAYSYFAPSSDGHTLPDFLSSLTLGLPGDPLPPLFAESAEPPPMPWKVTPTLGHFSGRALDEVGKPMDGLRFRLEGSTNRTLLVDANGWFGAVDLTPGGYFFSATNAATRYVGAVTVAAGTVSRADLLAAEADPDGDGFSNEAELLWETDPLSSMSVPVLVAAVETDGSVTLVFSPVSPRREYQLEAATDLLSMDWRSVPEVVGSESGRWKGIPLEGVRRFFRVQPVRLNLEMAVQPPMDADGHR